MVAPNTVKKEDPKPDPVNEAAARLVSAPEKGDPPSNTTIEYDFDFFNFDPADAIPHLKRAGMKQEEIDDLFKNFVVRWVNTDHRRYDKRIYQGWEPVSSPTGPIKRADLLLCRMPRERAKKMAAQLAERKRALKDAPMKRFDQEVAPLTKGGQFSTFEDNTPRFKR